MLQQNKLSVFALFLSVWVKHLLALLLHCGWGWGWGEGSTALKSIGEVFTQKYLWKRPVSVVMPVLAILSDVAKSFASWWPGWVTFINWAISGSSLWSLSRWSSPKKWWHLGYFCFSNFFLHFNSTWSAGTIFRSQKWFYVDVFDIQIQLWCRYFNVFWLEVCFGFYKKNWAIHLQSSGHPVFMSYRPMASTTTPPVVVIIATKFCKSKILDLAMGKL